MAFQVTQLFAIQENSNSTESNNCFDNFSQVVHSS